jgi:EAL domain-containing protein (putative c-di-GMP-specific phosphodiesterase class I)
VAGLIVEVTEDEIVRDLRLAQEIAARLRASGIKMAIDDFGPGYSSFASLRALAFVESRPSWPWAAISARAR